jgi:twitching motility protein PilT
MHLLLDDYIRRAVKNNISRLFFSVGCVVSYKDSTDQLIPFADTAVLTPKQMDNLVNNAVTEPKDKEVLKELGEVETILSSHGKMRCRVNVYLQRGTYAMTLTILTIDIDPIIPIDKWSIELDSILTKPEGGLCVITGYNDTEKLVASLIDYFNTNHKCHVVTLEDTITTLHRHNKAIVNQLELSPTNPCRNILRLKNMGVDVCVISSNKNEKFLNEITQIAMSGIFIIAVFNISSLDALKRSIVANMETHEWEELRDRLNKCIKLCIGMDNNEVVTEWLT